MAVNFKLTLHFFVFFAAMLSASSHRHPRHQHHQHHQHRVTKSVRGRNLNRAGEMLIGKWGNPPLSLLRSIY
eukprot:1196373-Prorocentrum_minimum.AAC.6